ncbi:hypothetical protein BXZ70DRAFT_1074595 [Cristinia sonorae]|uniref:RRN6 beta-propeller domain-containing protein n=1 Tax=Cristinia sonorae TaxID=1940300 RepID=A0A8K0UXB3_9AGAR|nr:hypothetical protein BXZ70DRAFT_1074595 [Cristinia sonorae]
MELWPGDERFRADIQNKEKKKAKGKGKYREELQPFPVYETGALTAATLCRHGKGFEWSFLSSAMLLAERKIVARCDEMIFPPTVPVPLKPSSATRFFRIEQAAHFLRSHYSDLEVSAELIRDYIEEDERIEESLRLYDPCAGNALAVISCNGARGTAPVAFLAYPSGGTSSVLNISLIPYSKQDGLSSKLSGNIPPQELKSPIRQILSANVGDAFLRRGDVTAFAVRTMQCVHVMRVSHPSQGGVVEVLSEIQQADVGNRTIVDMVFVFTPCDEVVLLVVTEYGGVYKSTTRRGYQTVYVMDPRKRFIHSPWSSECLVPNETKITSSIFRLQRRTEPDSLLLLSEKHLSTIHVKTHAVDLLMSLPLGPEVFTSIGPCDDGPTPVLTTTRILWIDPRIPQRPVLAVKHGRQSDQNLQLQSLNFDDIPFAFLSSRRNGLLTVYDVTYNEGGLLHLANAPYSLPGIHGLERRTRGEVIFRHPAEEIDTIATLLRLSDRGSLHRMDVKLLLDDVGDVCLIEPTVAEFSAEVRQVAEQGSRRTCSGPLGRRNREEFDFSEAYKEIFMNFSTADDPDAVYNLLDVMPDFWGNREVPVEHALTTIISFDIAFASGEEPLDSSRADFFKDTALSSVRGFRALVQGRIPRDQLMRRSPWHCDITANLSHFIPDMSSDPAVLANTLARYDLTTEEDRPAPSYRREAEAREQLALDLTLSASIFCSGFSETNRRTEEDEDMFDAMSRATEALSLGDTEPPPVAFGFLRPVKDDLEDVPNSTNGNSDQNICPLGVRLLLDDWKVGTDPGDYVYEDPYGVVQRPSAVKAFVRPRPPPMVLPSEMMPPPIQSMRPPVIAAKECPIPRQFPASQPQEIRREILGGSQPAAMGMDLSHSQTPFASTQVLSGPHGGRPPPIKKKPMKKRIINMLHREFSAIYNFRVLTLLAQTITTSPLPPLRSSSSRQPSIYLFDSAALHESLRRNKAVVCAISASYISTFAGYPLDSIKSRLQTTKTPISIPRLAALVYREEGVRGFYRGLWIPLMTISFVRAASFTIYTRTKEYFRDHNILARKRIFDVAASGGIGGALSGSLISFGSAPFELVKVRRQLEYSIAASKGIRLIKPPGTAEAIRDIFRSNGLLGLYTGFRLHFVRDTLGTALYFFEYDGLRHIMGRLPSGEQGESPYWLPLHSSLVPFFCGSVAGVTSWALIYPLDVVKTKVQQRALAGERYRPILETLHRLIRGPDPNAPKPFLLGMARIYRGLGVSALRSVTTHGLLWTFFDLTSAYIDGLPPANANTPTSQVSIPVLLRSDHVYNETTLWHLAGRTRRT